MRSNAIKFDNDHANFALICMKRNSSIAHCAVDTCVLTAVGAVATKILNFRFCVNALQHCYTAKRSS